MTLVFNVLLHGLLISSLLLFVGAVFLVTLKTEDPLELSLTFCFGPVWRCFADLIWQLPTHKARYTKHEISGCTSPT